MPTSLISIRIDEDLNRRLESLAQKTGRTKTYYIHEALASHIEDMEDSYLAAQRHADFLKSGERALTSAEVRAHLGLDG